MNERNPEINRKIDRVYYQNEIFNEETKINAKQNENEYANENAFPMISAFI